METLRQDIARNLGRYRGEGFSDLADELDWSRDLDLPADLELLESLDGSQGTAEADRLNTQIVCGALSSLTPSLANEEQLWVRLSHVEAFRYAQTRWLSSSLSDEELIQAVEKHLFAKTQTGIRDDHAVSRLWWNGHIARTCFPDDPSRGLELLLAKADVRSNLVERVWLTGRPNLGRGIFRLMDNDPTVFSGEKDFRSFMKAVNRRGGGIVFEAMAEAEVDTFLTECRNSFARSPA